MRSRFATPHFTRTEDGWRLAPRIVEAVRFSRANLMQLDATALGVYDFVFCRNVLIYFDRDAQQKALHALNSVLAENGTLFVGPAETGLLMRYGMQSAKIPLAFAFHRATPAEAQIEQLAHRAARHRRRTRDDAFASARACAVAGVFGRAFRVARSGCAQRRSTVSAAAPTAGFTASSQRTRMPPQPLAVARVDAVPPTNAARDTLQAAHALADAGRLTEAANAINVYLEQHAPHADAFYLLGVLADASGDTEPRTRPVSQGALSRPAARAKRSRIWRRCSNSKAIATARVC